MELVMMKQATRTMLQRFSFLLALSFWSSLAGAQAAQVGSGGAGASRGEADAADSSEGEGASSLTLEEARRAFLSGRRSMQQERWAAAAEQFETAVQVKDTPGLRYYIGYCREQQGRLVDAREAYRAAALLVEAEAAADVERLLPGALERVDAQLPRMRIEGLPRAATATVHGRRYQVAQGAFPLDPGQQLVVLAAPGHQKRSVHLEAARGQTRLLRLELRPLRSSAPPADASELKDGGASPRGKQVVFWTSAGVAVAGVGAGVAGLLVSADASSEVEEIGAALDDKTGGSSSACSSDVSRPEECSALQEATQRKEQGQVLSVVGFATAAAGASAALLTHYLWPDTSLDVGAVPLSGGGLLSIAGSF